MKIKKETAEIEKAAIQAGEWWADRLDSSHAEKKNAFASAIAIRIKKEMIDGKQKVFLECDYDPQGLLLEAVREVIDPQCRGFLFSARGILPPKHSLMVSRERLVPKEGYGNWTEEIVIK